MSELINNSEIRKSKLKELILKLHAGEVYKPVAPFFPAPLIEMAASIGFNHFQEKQSAGSFMIYFGKAQ